MTSPRSSVASTPAIAMAETIKAAQSPHDLGHRRAEEGDPMDRARRGSSPIHAFYPVEIEGFDALAELALDMIWSWNHSADEVWRELDPDLWEVTENPWVVLQTVSRDRLRHMLGDLAFR